MLKITTEALHAYKKMAFIRFSQQALVDIYLKEKIFSMVHFYIGQEAVAVGVCNKLTLEDKALGNHRSHGHYLAKGGDFRKLVCELFGRVNGASRGKGGSMHLIDKSVNFVGSTPLLGSVAPIAAGVAYEMKTSNKNNVVVAFYGDGASEEGVVYETYNLAALFGLPILFVIENNLNSINSTLNVRRSSAYDTALISKGLGVERYEKADGNDYFDVANKSEDLIEWVRNNQKPAILECLVFRHMAHSTPLFEERYRTSDHIDQRKNFDCMRLMRDYLLSHGVEEIVLDEMDSKLVREIEDAIAFAKSSPFPSKEGMYDDLFI